MITNLDCMLYVQWQISFKMCQFIFVYTSYCILYNDERIQLRCYFQKHHSQCRHNRATSVYTNKITQPYQHLPATRKGPSYSIPRHPKRAWLIILINSPRDKLRGGVYTKVVPARASKKHKYFVYSPFISRLYIHPALARAGDSPLAGLIYASSQRTLSLLPASIFLPSTRVRARWKVSKDFPALCAMATS